MNQSIWRGAATPPAITHPCPAAFCRALHWAAAAAAACSTSAPALCFPVMPVRWYSRNTISWTRTGTGAEPPGLLRNNGDKDIRTSFMNIGLQYMFNRSWGMTVEVPYWNRYFKTTDEDSGEVLASTHGALGDIRIKGLYSGFSPDMSTGITFGLKLPTGDSTFMRTSIPTRRSVPAAQTRCWAPIILAGSAAMAAGGGSCRRSGSNRSSPKMHTGQAPRWMRLRVSITAAGPSGAAAGVAPVLQLKGVYRDHDGGPTGDPQNTGYTRLLLTPGVQVDVSKVSIYMDLGIPVYTNATGNQLVAPLLWKLNVGYHF